MGEGSTRKYVAGARALASEVRYHVVGVTDWPFIPSVLRS